MHSWVPHRLYLGGIAIWALVLAIFPAWRGQGYWSTVGAAEGLPLRWYKAGAFGLQGGVDVIDFTQHAPLWSPPRPFGQLGGVSVRWPWQSPSGPHVELAWDMLAGEFAVGLIILGMAASLLARRRRMPPELTVTLARSVSVAIMVALLAMVVVGVVTMGALFEDGGVPALLGLGLVAGVAKGASTYHARQVATTERAIQPRPIGSSIAYLALGIVLAACLALAVAHIAFWFRGPVSNFQYVRTQWPIDLAAAISICGAGAIFAVWLWKRRMPRGLAAGILLACTVLAVTFNLWDPTFP